MKIVESKENIPGPQPVPPPTSAESNGSNRATPSTKRRRPAKQKLALDQMAIMIRDRGPVAQAAWEATYGRIAPIDLFTLKKSAESTFDPVTEAARQVGFTIACVKNRSRQANALLTETEDARLRTMLSRTTNCRPAGGYIFLNKKLAEDEAQKGYFQHWERLLQHTCDRIHFCPFCHYRKAEDLAKMIYRNSQKPATMIRLKFPCNLDELATYVKTTLAPYVRNNWLRVENALVVRPIYPSFLGTSTKAPMPSWEVNLWLVGYATCPRFKPNIYHEFVEVNELKPRKIDLMKAVTKMFAFQPQLLTVLKDDPDFNIVRRYFRFIYGIPEDPRRSGIHLCRMFAALPSAKERSAVNSEAA